MIFSSSLFLLYFLPFFLLVYWLLDRQFRNMFLLLVSVFFYAWGAPKFVFYVMGKGFMMLVRFHPSAWRKALIWEERLDRQHDTVSG